MKKLTQELKKYQRRLSDSQAAQLDESKLESLYSVYPFNRFEYIISHLIAYGAMTLEQYLDMRAQYISRNRYLYLFEMAPRTFGETWGQRHLMELVPEFQVPNRSLDPNYAGEYDLLLDGIKVEVKASRAVKKRGGSTLAEKALSSDTGEKFDMNYQQLKPGCCDVFVWIAVWRDKIDYWLLTAADVASHPLLSNQHRASRLTEDGAVVEGQIHINQSNYADFEQYRVHPQELLQKIRAIGKNRE